MHDLSRGFPLPPSPRVEMLEEDAAAPAPRSGTSWPPPQKFPDSPDWNWEKALLEAGGLTLKDESNNTLSDINVAPGTTQTLTASFEPDNQNDGLQQSVRDMWECTQVWIEAVNRVKYYFRNITSELYARFINTTPHEHQWAYYMRMIMSNNYNHTDDIELRDDKSRVENINPPANSRLVRRVRDRGFLTDVFTHIKKKKNQRNKPPHKPFRYSLTTYTHIF